MKICDKTIILYLTVSWPTLLLLVVVDDVEDENREPENQEAIILIYLSVNFWKRNSRFLLIKNQIYRLFFIHLLACVLKFMSRWIL